ncbi:hypothetical protein THARTR1_10369 [Trichoderma harzianum]|uniref:Uncharacterized protein n=1 Tax=Trichoderma harzianum TaxID=5544 RepID=A0A2K0TRS2_TRIHA|nr:hypothetical protein THARTR1_10369 [Trichoderma harzianum]
MSASTSILSLSQQCVGKLHEAMGTKDDTENQRLLKNQRLLENRHLLESRFASFNLWVDNVGAMAQPGASLDSRLRSRPDDLDLVRSILSLFSDFIDEYVTAVQNGLPMEEELGNIDAVVRNLAKIGVAIRRAGKASRSRRAHQSFNPDEHHEFKRHLECLILLRPNEDQPQLSEVEKSSDGERIDGPSTKSSEKHDVLKTKLEQLAKSRMDGLDSSRLNEIQKRLVDANLRRRHNFLLAQKRSQHLKKTAQIELKVDEVQLEVVPSGVTEAIPTADATDQTKIPASLKPNDQPTKSKTPPTVTGHTIASTAEGTLDFKMANSQQRAPTTARSQISRIATDTEFPKPPSSSQNQLMFKCPCCCQSLPSEDFTSAGRWR